MIITEANTYFLKRALIEPISHGGARHVLRHVGLTEIVTDEGLIGWGEGLSCAPRRILHDYVIGKDPFEAHNIWQTIAELGSGAMGFLSGIDIALNDVMAKARGEPVAKLLGKQVRRDVRAYASGLYRKDSDDDRHLVCEAKRYVDLGFKDIKMKVGFDVGRDIRNVMAVRDAIGDDVSLAIDANCAYSFEQAAEAGRALENCRILFFEEPLALSDINGYRALKQAIPIPIAGGEMLREQSAFAKLIETDVLDIVQPDISICGGFTGFQKIATAAEKRGVLVMPHMWGGILRLAATLQMLAVLPLDRTRQVNLMLEYDMTENPFRTALSPTEIPAIGGGVHVPDGPGLGVAINRERVQAFL